MRMEGEKEPSPSGDHTQHTGPGSDTAKNAEVAGIKLLSCIGRYSCQIGGS
jgi:hypothetical protein